MRKHFGAYYRPGPEDFRALHAGIVSLDANVLLNLYRYSAQTRDEFVALLEKIEPRLWLTHQVASEFHKARLGVIAGQLEALAQARKTLQAAQTRLGELYRSPSKESKDRWAKVTGAWKTLDVYVSDLDKEAVRPTSDAGADRIWGRLTALFENRVGEPYPPEERRRLIEEGNDRYAKRIPPGYEDADKNGDAASGDWLVWRQLLDHAKSEGRPIVLVTDDKKEDWWVSSRGETVAPRPELIEEMAAEAGQLFYMYQPDQFLKVIGLTVKQEASGSAIKELQSLPPRTANDNAYLLVRPARELAAARHRSAVLRQQLAEVTAVLASAPPDATSRRENVPLLELEADLRTKLAVSERLEWNLQRLDRSHVLYGGGPAVSGPTGPSGPIFGSSTRPFSVGDPYDFESIAADRLLNGPAGNITYPMLGQHGEWVRGFDQEASSGVQDDKDLPDASGRGNESPNT